MTNIINSIDISECPLFDKNTGCYHTFNGECVKDSCGVYKWLLEHKRLQEENVKLKKALSDIKEIVKEISYLGSRGERELRFKIKNILEEVIDEEIY